MASVPPSSTIPISMDFHEASNWTPGDITSESGDIGNDIPAFSTPNEKVPRLELSMIGVVSKDVLEAISPRIRDDVAEALFGPEGVPPLGLAAKALDLKHDHDEIFLFGPTHTDVVSSTKNCRSEGIEVDEKNIFLDDKLLHDSSGKQLSKTKLMRIKGTRAYEERRIRNNMAVRKSREKCERLTGRKRPPKGGFGLKAIKALLQPNLSNENDILHNRVASLSAEIQYLQSLQ